MMNRYRILMFMPLFLLYGCSGHDDATLPDASSKELLFDEQIQSLEKAQAVEQVLQDGADIHRQAIDQQTE